MRLILITSLLFLSFASSNRISIDSVVQEINIEDSIIELLNKERSNLDLDELERSQIMDYACQYHSEYLYKLQRYLGSKESFYKYCKTQVYNEDQTHYENIDIPKFDELKKATSRLSKYTDDTLAYECVSILYKNKPFNLEDANTIVDKFMKSSKHKDALLMEKMVKELYFDKSNNLVPRIENIENIGISVNQIEYNIDGVTEYAIITVINTR